MILPAAYCARMKKLLGGEYSLYESSLSQPPVRAVKVNTHKISVSDFTEKSGIPVKMPGLFDDCFILGENFKIGKNPLHHGGAVYVQEPGAMLPVIAADFNGGEKVLDMCAAPGGKTVQAACRASEVLANEIDYKRAVTLAGNIERMGFKNVAVSNYSPDALENFYCGYFDAVIVDAPCSGEGMFRKELSAIADWSEENVSGCAARQKKILVSADKTLRAGGKLIYSTCTFAPEENEDNVAFLVRELGYELIAPSPVVIPYSVRGEERSGLNPEYMRRVYPHNGIGEGQFFAVLIKTAGKSHGFKADKLPSAENNRLFCEFNKKFMKMPLDCKIAGSGVVLSAFDVPQGMRMISRGVKVGELLPSRFVPAHNMFTALWKEVAAYMETDEDLAARYLHGEELPCDLNGWLVVRYLGVPLGGGKASGGTLKNHYPKGLRNFTVEIK